MPKTNDTAKRIGVHDIKAADWVRMVCLKPWRFDGGPSVFYARDAPFLFAYAFTDDDGRNV